MEFSLFLAQFAKGSSRGNTIPEEEPSHISFDLFSFKRILICLFYKFLLSLHTALCQYLYILCNIIDQRYDCKYQRYPDQYLCDHVKCTAKICDQKDQHEHLGYRLIGEFRKCGYKFGRWYHMVWMEKIIADHPARQPDVIPFAQIPLEIYC